MTDEQAEAYAKSVQHATQVSLQEFRQRAQAAAVAAATAAAERAGAGTPGLGGTVCDCSFFTFQQLTSR